MTEEIWKTVTVNTSYVVSDRGHVHRTAWVNGAKSAGRSLGYNLQNGYRAVTLYDDKHKRKTYLIHQLVAEAFIGPCPAGKDVNHMDGNKRNNRAENLEYVTPSENTIHAYKTGLITPARGAQSGSARLTNRQVRRIRVRYKGGASMADIARRLKVGLTTVSDICNRKTWTHI